MKRVALAAFLLASPLSLAVEPPTAAASAPLADPLSPQVCEAIIKATPKELWKVWSTPEGFKQLGVAKVEMDFRPGGLIRSHYNPEGVLGDEGTIENEILAFEPERMLAIRIHKPPKGFPFAEAWKRTWSVMSMTDLGDGRTHVRLVGLGYDQSEESTKMREFFEKGNGWTLQRLATQFDSSAPAPTGPAHATAPLAPISLETTVARPRAEVWRLISTSAGWKEFFGVESAIEARPGGKFEVYFNMAAAEGERGSEGCRVLSVLPNEMLSYEWNAPPKFTHARGLRTWVVVMLEEVSPALTRVRVVHDGFASRAAEHAEHLAEWEQTRAYLANAWPKVLGALRDVGTAKAAGR